MKDVALKMRTVQDDLDLLPHSFDDNPQAGLLALCSEFISQTDEYTNGTPNHPSFFQELHEKFWKLSTEIIGTRPTFETALKSSTGEQAILMTAFTVVLPSPPLSTEVEHLTDSKRNGEQCFKGKEIVRW
jgi:hypothetical protein